MSLSRLTAHPVSVAVFRRILDHPRPSAFRYRPRLLSRGSSFALSSCADAQTTNGQITGVITDATGAVLRGAAVIVVNTLTNVTSRATSDRSGAFQVLSLPIGTYTVKAEKDGFAST